MKEFNRTAEGQALPEYPHLERCCDCAECAAIYQRRKKIIDAEIRQQESYLAQYAAPSNSLSLIGVALIVAMAIFLLGWLNC